MTVAIRVVDAEGASDLLPGLAALLADAVDAGASVGFWPPMRPSRALAYWHGVLEEVKAGCVLLLVAEDGGTVVGSVQLAPSAKENGPHLAEVRKLFVLAARRRRGIGRALLASVEAEALARGRTCLVLDTRTGDPSERLYAGSGWVRVGEIPRYVREHDGTETGTTVYYRHLA